MAQSPPELAAGRASVSAAVLAVVPDHDPVYLVLEPAPPPPPHSASAGPASAVEPAAAAAEV